MHDVHLYIKTLNLRISNNTVLKLIFVCDHMTEEEFSVRKVLHIYDIIYLFHQDLIKSLLIHANSNNTIKKISIFFFILIRLKYVFI